MSDPVARGLSAAALVGLLVTAALLVQLDRRVAQVQRSVRASEQAEARVRPGRVQVTTLEAPVPAAVPAPEPVASPAPPGAPPERKPRGRRPARLNELPRATVEEVVVGFAQSRGLSAEVSDAMRDELLLFEEGAEVVREDVMDGHLTAVEGRAELRAMAADSQARIVELVGEPAAVELREALAARAGRRRAGGPLGD